MPFYILLLILILRPVSGAQAGMFTQAEAERWREDLRYLARELPRIHKSLYHTMTREQFEASVNALDGRIPDLTRERIIAEITRIVARVGDGHTHLMLRDPAVGFRHYPVRFYMFRDGLYLRAAHRRHAAAVGGRILKIGKATADLNDLGYELLRSGRTTPALQVLKLAVERFPASANAWDSLGEAHMVAGDRESAIRSYEKSLELNPKNGNARIMLRRLKH